MSRPTIVHDCWDEETSACLCNTCLYWQTRRENCCAPDALTLYLSRHTDVLCLIKWRIRREFPDDDWNENEAEDEEEPHELYVQLEHERAHQRNMQPGRRAGYWETNGAMAQDPDSVICWF